MIRTLFYLYIIACTLLLLAAAAHAAPVMVADSQSEYWLPLDANGWTVLPENTDPSAVTIYVSSSEGSNDNDGLSAETPVATIAYARSLCRNANNFWDQPGYTTWTNYVNGIDTVEETITWYSDWILLKCGDTWAEGLPVTEGESPENPFVYSSYGSGDRPVVSGIARSASNDHNYSNFCVIGIEFTGGVSINGEYYQELGWAYPSYYLFEDCVVRNMVSIRVCGHVTFRRCVIVDSYSTSDHRQGLYLYNSDNSLVEESLFDHNGWHDTIIGAEPTVYNHNLYIKENCSGFTFRNCITARASATGAQLRAGGDCVNNLFLDNPLALDWGYVNGSPITPGGVTGEVTDNVVLGAANICRPRPGCTGTPRGVGFSIGNVASGTISGNIISTANVEATNNNAITLTSMGSDITNPEDGVGLNNLTVSDNIVYAWDGGAIALLLATINCDNVVVSNNTIHNTTNDWQVFKLPAGWTGITLSNNRYWAGTKVTPFAIDTSNYTYAQWVTQTGETGSSNTEPSWTAPTRSIATYMANLGYAEGDQTIDKFLELARANSKADWDVRFTADAVNDYIRAGFVE